MKNKNAFLILFVVFVFASFVNCHAGSGKPSQQKNLSQKQKLVIEDVCKVTVNDTQLFVPLYPLPILVSEEPKIFLPEGYETREVSLKENPLVCVEAIPKLKFSGKSPCFYCFAYSSELKTVLTGTLFIRERREKNNGILFIRLKPKDKKQPKRKGGKNGKNRNDGKSVGNGR